MTTENVTRWIYCGKELKQQKHTTLPLLVASSGKTRLRSRAQKTLSDTKQVTGPTVLLDGPGCGVASASSACNREDKTPALRQVSTEGPRAQKPDASPQGQDKHAVGEASRHPLLPELLVDLASRQNRRAHQTTN
eukprot:4745368-Amphidinium_carterae.2